MGDSGEATKLLTSALGALEEYAKERPLVVCVCDTVRDSSIRTLGLSDFITS